MAGYYLWLGIIGTISVGTMLGIIIYQLIISKKKIKIEKTTRIINYLSEWTNGHSEGWLVTQKKYSNGLAKIEFYPTDLSKKEKKEEIKTETVIAKNIKTVPMGVLSSNVNIMKIYPNTINEFVRKEPYLKFNLKLLDLEKNKEIGKLLNTLFEAIKLKNNEKSVNDIMQKLEETLKKYPEKKEELEKLMEEIKALVEDYNERIKEQNSIINSIGNISKNISTNDLFSHSILKEDMMFNMGKTFKKSYDAVSDTVDELHFGAISKARMKEMEENIRLMLNEFLAKNKEEKKVS